MLARLAVFAALFALVNGTTFAQIVVEDHPEKTQTMEAAREAIYNIVPLALQRFLPLAPQPRRGSSTIVKTLEDPPSPPRRGTFLPAAKAMDRCIWEHDQYRKHQDADEFIWMCMQAYKAKFCDSCRIYGIEGGRQCDAATADIHRVECWRSSSDLLESLQRKADEINGKTP